MVRPLTLSFFLQGWRFSSSALFSPAHWLSFWLSCYLLGIKVAQTVYTVYARKQNVIFGGQMDLILWRHAEAVDGTPDHARELTPRGIKQAGKIADFLRPHLPDDCRILASPATRAQQTATALTSHFTLAPTIAPGASAQAVLHAARWPDGRYGADSRTSTGFGRSRRPPPRP